MALRAVELIRQKRDGHPLAPEDIQALIEGYTQGTVPDYQMSAMAMAIVFQGLNPTELAAWTEAMLRSGDQLDLGLPPDTPVIDKHSTGGVGDTTSLMLAPLAAACGLHVPMISGRGLGHTGGTLDKLESIPGFDVALTSDRLRSLVHDHGFVITGQTAQLAPADRKLYALRDVTGTVRCIPLIASSIMSKKLAEGLTGLVLDVKTGSGAFMANLDDARRLARTMVGIGQRMGVTIHALITAMDQPLGHTIGNALEVREAIDVLRNEGPDDMTTLTLQLTAHMLRIAGRAPDHATALATARAALQSGAALERFRTVVQAQGGDPHVIDKPDLLPTAPIQYVWSAPHEGVLSQFACAKLGMIAARLGAGRSRAGDPIDHAVGLVVHHKRGTLLRGGDPLVTIHARDSASAQEAAHALAQAITLTDEAPEPRPLILETVQHP
ncbi:MAG: thymidine phosphorylase [Myxococcota bacterium]